MWTTHGKHNTAAVVSQAPCKLAGLFDPLTKIGDSDLRENPYPTATAAAELEDRVYLAVQHESETPRFVSLRTVLTGLPLCVEDLTAAKQPVHAQCVNSAVSLHSESTRVCRSVPECRATGNH